jgi:hypothetical protein
MVIASLLESLECRGMQHSVRRSEVEDEGFRVVAWEFRGVENRQGVDWTRPKEVIQEQ